MHVDCTMMTPIDATMHVSRRIKHHQHALVVNKKNMMNHTLAWELDVNSFCAMSRWLHVFFFFFAGQKTWVVAANTLCDDHAEFLTLPENYRRLSLVARPWQRLSLNLSHCMTQDHDHRNLHDCFPMPIFRLGQPKIVQCVSGLRVGWDISICLNQGVQSCSWRPRANLIHSIAPTSESEHLEAGSGVLLGLNTPGLICTI